MGLTLPEKKRPQKFGDIIGQPSVSLFLSELIKRGPISKNIIISGPWGSGKTTGARLYARALNCESPTNLGDPCNTCSNCTSHLKDSYPECIEFDGATAGRVEHMRNLIEVCRQPPLYGKYRVVIIDECQGLSYQSWDALLKIIESPPPFLVFLFTTTDYDKVRPAIKSRCNTLTVATLTPKDSHILLNKVLAEEQWTADQDAKNLLVSISKGHSRDLLKNLEQVAFVDSHITTDMIHSMFSINYIDSLCSLFESLSQDDFSKTQSIIQTWPEPVELAYQHISEFALYLLYKSQNLHLDVNPLFEQIDHEKIDAICNSLASVINFPVSDVFREILGFLSKVPIKSTTVLASSVAIIHSFVIDNRGAPKTLGHQLKVETKHKKLRSKRPNMITEIKAYTDVKSIESSEITLDDLRNSGFNFV